MICLPTLLCKRSILASLPLEAIKCPFEPFIQCTHLAMGRFFLFKREIPRHDGLHDSMWAIAGTVPLFCPAWSRAAQHYRAVSSRATK